MKRIVGVTFSALNMLYSKINTTHLLQKSLLIFQTAFVNPPPDDLELLTERLKLRVTQGCGECIYEVGVAGNSLC